LFIYVIALVLSGTSRWNWKEWCVGMLHDGFVKVNYDRHVSSIFFLFGFVVVRINDASFSSHGWNVLLMGWRLSLYLNYLLKMSFIGDCNSANSQIKETQFINSLLLEISPLAQKFLKHFHIKNQNIRKQFYNYFFFHRENEKRFFTLLKHVRHRWNWRWF
jgi:hypothetical protein